MLTQLARVEGCAAVSRRGERIIDEAETLAASSEIARARIDLERGRLRRTGGNTAAALPLFVAAFALALEADTLYVAVDAAHMAALAAPDQQGFLDWTDRGVVLAERGDPDVRYWLGPLLNNLGWHHYEAGDHEGALAAFRRALGEREQNPENRAAIEVALYAVAKTLQALGRLDEGAPMLERAVVSADGDGRPDGWICEELAETYAALGRAESARDNARRALLLLPEADPEFGPDGERAMRLSELAGNEDAEED